MEPETEKRKRPLCARILRWFIVIVGVLLTLFVVGYPLIVAYFSVALPGGAVGAPPEGFDEITLTADNGDSLAAWYALPENGAVIILLHGAGASRDDLRTHANLLIEHDYGVLALDLRGHGESGGQPNMYAWQGTGDVGAAVAYLETQDDVDAIGGWGISLGAEVLLGAASTYPQIRAIISDGATHRTYADSREASPGRVILSEQMTWLMYTGVRLFSGDTPPPRLVESLAAAEDTRFLLIAAENAAVEPPYNRRFMEVLGERGDLWIAPNVSHIGAFNRYRDEYTERLLTFFDEALRDPSA